MDIQLGRLRRMLAERGLKLELTATARHFLAEAGYDPTYGARPLKRAVQQYVQDPLAMALLEGQFHSGDVIVAEVAPQGGQLVFTQHEMAEPAPA